MDIKSIPTVDLINEIFSRQEVVSACIFTKSEVIDRIINKLESLNLNIDRDQIPKLVVDEVAENIYDKYMFDSADDDFNDQVIANLENTDWFGQCLNKHFTTFGQRDDNGLLPTNVVLNVDFIPDEDKVVDMLSDEYGFLVKYTNSIRITTSGRTACVKVMGIAWDEND